MRSISSPAIDLKRQECALPHPSPSLANGWETSALNRSVISGESVRPTHLAHLRNWGDHGPTASEQRASAPPQVVTALALPKFSHDLGRVAMLAIDGLIQGAHIVGGNPAPAVQTV